MEVSNSRSLNSPLTIDDFKRLFGSLSFSAEKPITQGPDGGSFNTLNRQPNGDYDGIADYRPGVDKVQDISAIHTCADNRFRSRRRLGEAKVEDVFLIAETGERTPTGKVTLTQLTRMVIAAAALAAENDGSHIYASYVADKRSPSRLGYGYDGAESPKPRALLRAFDRYSQQDNQDNRRDRDTDQCALAEELRWLNQTAPNYDPDTSEVIVVSDFISGPIRNKDGSLTGFSWEKPLSSIRNQLADRLKIVRLITPSFVHLPNTGAYKTDHGIFDMEYGDYLVAEERIRQQGTEKHELLAKYLARYGEVVLNTDSTDKELIKSTSALLLS